MPPITVTMKDSIRTENPMPGVSDRTGRGKRAGEAGQHAAQREHPAVDQAGVDAERRHHARIVRGGADHLADPGAGEAEPEDAATASATAIRKR